MFFKLSVFIFCFCLFEGYYCENGPTLEIPLGKIRGNHATSFGGRKFSAFEGIPYAKPPVGERRFQNPEPIEPWDGVWDATFRSKCVQVVMHDHSIISGDEDCLYINIYVPRDTPNPNEKLDVIVNIHGGSYMFGVGHLSSNPKYLVDKDVILVNFNYRLGFFGFLSTGDDVISGNYGLKDQVLALRFVQENIAHFGGNADSVTLVGHSAGGSSVHLHYFSPQSKGLFHRGFSQSGCALNPWAIQREPLMKAKILALAIGCPDSPTKALAKCLKQRPYLQFLSKLSLFLGYKFEPLATFGPVIEKGSDPFLIDYPYRLLVAGQVQDLPWITHNVAHEGLSVTADYKNNLNELNTNWGNLAPFSLYYNYTIAKSSWKSTAQKIKDFYLGQNQDVSDENFDKFVKIYTDGLGITDAETAANLQANVTNSSVYYYYFGYSGDHSKTVDHGEDLQYFYYNFTGRELSQNELKMKDILVNMLVSYAKTGEPVINGVTWMPTKSDELTYLNISDIGPDGIKLQTVKEITDRNFWKSLGIQKYEK